MIIQAGCACVCGARGSSEQANKQIHAANCRRSITSCSQWLGPGASCLAVDFRLAPFPFSFLPTCDLFVTHSLTSFLTNFFLCFKRPLLTVLFPFRRFHTRHSRPNPAELTTARHLTATLATSLARGRRRKNQTRL